MCVWCVVCFFGAYRKIYTTLDRNIKRWGKIIIKKNIIPHLRDFHFFFVCKKKSRGGNRTILAENVICKVNIIVFYVERHISCRHHNHRIYWHCFDHFTAKWYFLSREHHLIGKDREIIEVGGWGSGQFMTNNIFRNNN